MPPSNAPVMISRRARDEIRMLAFAAALSTATTAHAQSVHSGIQLTWVRAESASGCVDQVALADDVSRHLGRSAIEPTTGRAVEGWVARTNGHFVAHLYLRGPRGELLGMREIVSDASNCDAIRTAVAVAIALVVDGVADTPTSPSGSETPDSSPSPSSSPPPDRSPGPTARPASALSPRQRLCRERPRSRWRRRVLR